METDGALLAPVGDLADCCAELHAALARMADVVAMRIELTEGEMVNLVEDVSNLIEELAEMSAETELEATLKLRMAARVAEWCLANGMCGEPRDLQLFASAAGDVLACTGSRAAFRAPAALTGS